jgi:hypothetical protein
VDRRPNDRLAALLSAAGWSHAGLAKRVNDGCKTRGFPRSYTATSVANWLSGMVPAAPVSEVLAQLLADRLARPITLIDLGYAEEVPLDLGLTWAATTRATVGAVTQLWKVDMERRAILFNAAWMASAFATPTREWLLNWADDDASHTGSRRVGTAEIDVVWSMCYAFADADHRLGGGYARATLIHYVNQVVLPLLDGTYTDEVGRRLMAAAARLCDLAGFMAFDSGAQGLGQRYYIQALRLAHAGRDRALGAHILADMAMQAHYLGDSAEACSLARAGQRAAKESGSHCTLARCCAMEARAHAQSGGSKRCGEAMTRAEQALEHVCLDDEPFWIRFFTPEQLQAEFAYAAGELKRPSDVRAFALPVLAAAGEMERRRVLVTAALAASYVEPEGKDNTKVDVDQACAILTEAAPLVPVLTTKRGIEAVNRVRRRLAPYQDQESVRRLEATFVPLIGAAA